MKITIAQLAYAAGFFDGEGCCLITPNCMVRIIIAQKDPTVLMWLAIRWGGKVTLPYGKQATAKLWINSKVEILKFLSDIRPYMHIKCFEVDLALQMLALNATNHTRPQANNGLFLPNPNKVERDRIYQLYKAHREKTSQQSVSLHRTLKRKKEAQ